MSLYSRLDRIAADVEKLNRQVNSVANAPQSQRTSVEGGSIDFNDADGNLKAIVGEQEDGGNTVNVVAGPTPPTPTNFTVTVDHGSLTVHWDGDFEDGAVAPSDWARWTAYAQAGQFVVPDRTTSIGGTDSASGGEVTAGVLKGEWTVTLLAWSQAGKPSAMATPVTVDVPGYGDIVLTEIDAAETVIKNAGEVLVSEQGTLDEKLTEVDGSLNDLGQDLQAVEDAQAQLNTDLTDVMTSVDGKNTITWNPSAPSKASNPGKAVGDMWYRTSGNSIIGFWKWNGTDWVTQLLDKTTIPLIDIGAGTFGSLAGSRLEVGSIYADRIVSGLSQNMVPDPGFVNAEINASRVAASEGMGGAWSISSGVVKFNSSSVTLTTNANIPLAASADKEAWPAYPGMTMVFRVKARVVSGSGRFRATAYLLRRNGTRVYVAMNPAAFVPLTNEWAEYAFTYVLGDDIASYTTAIQVSQSSVGVFEFTAPFSASTVGTTVIEDGAVSTGKLSADVLEVKNLKATSGQLNEAVINKLFSDVVVAKMAVANAFIGENAILTGAVTAPKITASEELWAKIAEFVKIRAEHIEADAIDGMVITGATIRSAASGARTLMSASGFEAYDNTGKRTFFASASTGEVSITGKLFTGEPGFSRVSLDPTLWSSLPVYNDDGEIAGYANGAGVRVGVDASNGLDIYHAGISGGVRSGVIRGPGGKAKVVLSDGAVQFSGGDETSATNAWFGRRFYALSESKTSSNERSLIELDAQRVMLSTQWGPNVDSADVTTGYGFARLNATYQGKYSSLGAGGGDIEFKTHYEGFDTAKVRLVGSTSAGATYLDISAESINPVRINYAGAGDSWIIPFSKDNVSWGYIGSSGMMGVNEFGIQSAANKNLVLTTTTGSAGIVAKTNGDVTFSDSKGVNFSNIPVSSGTGVNVTAGGWFQKNTSSLRYKTDVEPVDMSGFDVLSLEPKSFVYKDQKARFEKPRDEWGEYEEEIFANGLPTSYGLIAEEVENAGGQFAVNYDQEGLPDSLNYGLIGVALIPTVRELRDRIAELERRLNE